MGGCVAVQEFIQVRGNKTSEGSEGEEQDFKDDREIQWKPLKRLGNWADVLTSGDDTSA